MNAQVILGVLDGRLNAAVELTLYGRAALQMGFSSPPPETLLSRDVDAVLWLGQAEDLNQRTNFWEAVDATNAELSSQGLYVSHFFTEDQVVLRPEWKAVRRRIDIPFRHLRLFRLADEDLLLSKLMRDDPQDQQDALFIVGAAGWRPENIEQILSVARLPDVAEIRDEFAKAARRLRNAIKK